MKKGKPVTQDERAAVDDAITDATSVRVEPENYIEYHPGLGALTMLLSSEERASREKFVKSLGVNASDAKRIKQEPDSKED